MIKLKARTLSATLLIFLSLLNFPGTARTEPEQDLVDREKEDREIIAMMDLLEIIDLLQNMDLLVVIEDKKGD